MIKPFLLIFGTLLSFSQANVFGQTFEKVFFTKQYLSLYEGALVKVDSTHSNGFTSRFFYKFEDALNDKVGQVAFTTGSNRVSERELMKGKVFRVHKLLNIEGNKPSVEFLKIILNDKIIFHLVDTLSKDSVYFVHNANDNWTDFPFLTSKLNPLAFQQFIEKEVDDFDGGIRFTHPNANRFYLMKIQTNGKAAYYLRLEADGLTPNISIKGVTLLFTDGSVMKKPLVDIDTDVKHDGSGYVYSTFMTLSIDEVRQLGKKPIKKYRLYVYDEQIGIEDAVLLTGFANALLKAK
jgi:hypothetical protein